MDVHRADSKRRQDDSWRELSAWPPRFNANDALLALAYRLVNLYKDDMNMMPLHDLLRTPAAWVNGTLYVDGRQAHFPLVGCMIGNNWKEQTKDGRNRTRFTVMPLREVDRLMCAFVRDRSGSG